MNNNKYSILGLLFVSLSMIGLPAAAVTPDGQTPAEETICDDLKADGVSKGLYGLCVAFCEAQDFADISIPTTEAEFENLSTSAPSGKILANYNKRKQETDPPMPCIAVESPCPCITAGELFEINGDLNGVSLDTFNCKGEVNGNTVYAQEFNLLEQSTTARHVAVSTSNGRCQYIDTQTPITPNRDLSLTSDEVTSCRTMIDEHCAGF